MFNDYGVDRNYYGCHYEMCLIAQGGQKMNSRNLFGTVIYAFLIFAASSIAALGQNVPAACRLVTDNVEDSPPLFSETAVEYSQGAACANAGCIRPCSNPQWTALAEFIILDRIGSVNRTLVERVPGTVAQQDLSNAAGVAALNANDFQQGFSSGPRLGLIRHGGCGYDLEMLYYQIDGWSSARSVGPDDPPDWLVMKAPGGFLQTQDHPDQAMAWDYATKLNNLEFNLRSNPCDRITLLAGFRWLELREDLKGILAPPTFSWEPPFWNTDARNNLYGFQIGADGKLLDYGRFSISGLIKAGIYDNQADQLTGVSIFKVTRPSFASTNHAAFVGEIDLQCRYQATSHLAFRAGYEAIWLQGIALAPGQIEETYTIPLDIVVAQGVNCDGGVFYHGATAGLEYAF
jgi:Putative beta barrel porin-7 (BBP7)